MPRYKYNEDGSLTILDDSSDSHQPEPHRPLRPTNRRNDRNSGNSGLPVFRARTHVLLIILGIVAAILMLASCSDSGGQFVHKMSDEEWVALKKSSSKHSVAEQIGASLGTSPSMGREILTKSGSHDWEQGLGLLGPGMRALSENMGHNFNELGEMVEDGLDDLGISS